MHRIVILMGCFVDIKDNVYLLPGRALRIGFPSRRRPIGYQWNRKGRVEETWRPWFL